MKNLVVNYESRPVKSNRGTYSIGYLIQTVSRDFFRLFQMI